MAQGYKPTPLFQDLGLRFGTNFLYDHAGLILEDPRIAIVELIANAYDAGAMEVALNWPEAHGGIFELQDNGIGMTRDQLERRWQTLNYDRLGEQGDIVEFPPKTRKKGVRHAFGQNGKGRFGAFCFSDAYTIETWKDGELSIASVEVARGDNKPFQFNLESTGRREGHGTIIRADVTRKLLPISQLSEAIGSKFLVDPTFCILVNASKLKLFDLEHLVTHPLEISPYGTINIHQIDATVTDRTMRLKGIAWWVNGRMVGEPSWSDLTKEGAVLDGRSTAAKTYSFIIEADILRRHVKQDWSGFRATEITNAVETAARQYVIDALRGLLYQTRKERKQAALRQNRTDVSELSSLSQRVVGEFIDRIQDQCPKISEADLTRAVGILAKMEQSRSAYDLLKRLYTCSPDDLDTWNEIMSKWSAQQAEVVLGELERRLRIIDQLQKMADHKTADELHDLQPIFEKGLWIFGPEYEAVDFRSNLGMAEVIRGLLKVSVDTELSRRRADFVILPDASIGFYGADDYDEQGEIIGIRKLLILELKNGSFDLTQKELDQGRDYGKELQRVGAVQKSSEINVLVLGDTIESGLDSMQQGTISVKPVKYDIVLKRAHSRTFHLKKKLQEISPYLEKDFDVLEILSEEPQLGLEL